MVSTMSCGLNPWRVTSHKRVIICSAVGDDHSGKKKVVLVGGTGRVGSSTARSLARLWPGINLVLADRSSERGQELASQIGTGTTFQKVDIQDLSSIADAIAGSDLVIHSAGPFQAHKRCTVLEAAIECKVPYLDVCDDLNHARVAKSFHEKAVEANIPAVITTGLYPGVSNIMAAELVRLAKESSTDVKPVDLRFSYFTAGSGGAGPTLLATSFLLLREPVFTFIKGKLVKQKPFTDGRVVDFGKGVGKREVFLLNLPEVATAHQFLDVPSVCARFGTSPFLWNWIMNAIAGKEFLNDSSKMTSFVKVTNPLVRAIDQLVGSTVSIRVDLTCSDGKRAIGLLTHRKLTSCVGTATAAFADPILRGRSQPGVWFPEQEEAVPIEDRQQLLKDSAKGALSFVMNRSPWMIESEPKEIGFGIYLE